jgi:transcriptional regulator with XRE-family HTH domain
MTARTTEPIADVLPAILAERGMSVRGLARRLGVDIGHVSRALRPGATGKSLSADLVARIRAELDLPPGYFVEEREAAVIARIRDDPRERDGLYDRWFGSPDP